MSFKENQGNLENHQQNLMMKKLAVEGCQVPQQLEGFQGSPRDAKNLVFIYLPKSEQKQMNQVHVIIF